MNLEELPETRTVEIEELERGLKEGKVYVLAERIVYGFGGLASNVGADLTPEILNRLRGEGGSTNLQREGGKSRSAPIEIFEFKGGESERRSFLTMYGRGVETLERLKPIAREYREGALSDVRKINDQLRQVIRTINLEERAIGKRLEEKARLGDLLNDRQLKANLYTNLISPACQDPAVLLWLSYRPDSFEHATDVAGLRSAIEYRAVLGGRREQDLDQFERDRLDMRLGKGVRAALLHDAGDEYFIIHSIKEGSEQYKKIFPLRDFVIPRRMFSIAPDDEKKRRFVIDADEVEAIEHHHTPRHGRVVDLGRDRRVAFIPKEIYDSYERNPDLWSRVQRLFEMEKSGEVSVQLINTDMHQSLYLAEWWVTEVGHNSTRLNAVTQYKKLKSMRGLFARDDLVDALLGIVGEKYFRS